MIRTALVLWCACVAVELAALVGAALDLRRTPAAGSPGARTVKRAVVALLAFAVASDVLVDGGRALLLAGAPRPFVGLARAWYHVETAIVLGWPSGLALAAWTAFVFPGRAGLFAPAPAAAWGGWLGVTGGLIAAHPLGRTRTAAAMLALELACLAIAWLAVAKGWRRPWSLPHVALVVLVGIETSVALVGPWVRNPFADWHLARISYLFGFIVVALLHVQRVRQRLRL